MDKLCFSEFSNQDKEDLSEDISRVNRNIFKANRKIREFIIVERIFWSARRGWGIRVRVSFTSWFLAWMMKGGVPISRQTPGLKCLSQVDVGLKGKKLTIRLWKIPRNKVRPFGLFEINRP
jgi:hypothetical protein